jgi:hypothetical protein
MIIAVLALVPLWASAQKADLPDANDTQGLMDVKRVKFSPGERPRFKFITFARWTADRIWDRGVAVVHFDTVGDGHYEYYATVRSNGLKMIGELWRDRKNKRDYKMGKIGAWRKGERNVILRVPLKKMATSDRRPYYRWFAKTLMIGTNCQRVCIDRIPNEGALRQTLPGVVPEPSPTPTEEPTDPPTEEPTDEPGTEREPTPQPSGSPSPSPSATPSPSASP